MRSAPTMVLSSLNTIIGNAFEIGGILVAGSEVDGDARLRELREPELGYVPGVTDIELVTRYYDLFNRGDWDGMCALLADDVAHDLNQGERQVGRAAFRAFLDRMARSYRERLRDICVMGDGRGRVGAEYVVEGEYLATDEGLPAASGQRYTLPGGAFFAVRGGHIARVTNYYNLTDWFRQVGA